jgi:hypothetical protein
MSFKSRILEEAQLKPEQIQLIKELAKKENLRIGYGQNSRIGDNAVFMTKKEYDNLLQDLKKPAFLEKIFKNTKLAKSIKNQRRSNIKTLEEAAQQSVNGFIDDGVILLGKGKIFSNKPETISHELGHAVNHKENRWLMPLRNRLITGLGGLTSYALARQDHPGLAALTAALSFAPTLYDEGKASLRGYKNLKEMGKNPSMKPLALGFGTYALGASLPVIYGIIRSDNDYGETPTYEYHPNLLSDEVKKEISEKLNPKLNEHLHSDIPLYYK